MIITLSLLLISTVAEARVVTYKAKGEPSDVEAHLRANGFMVEATYCAGGTCRLILPDAEKKDPSRLIAGYTPPPKKGPATEEDRSRLLNELAGIEVKLDKGTATTTELMRAVKILLVLQGLAAQ